VHALILFLILGPVISTTDFTHDPAVGGGGAGPAGGGGGGSGGARRSEERVQFVRVKPDNTAVPVVKPVVVPPVKQPEVKPPLVAPVTPPPAAAPPATTVVSGEGAGNAGTPGAGPGTGGGIGSGVGTGTGSGIGPGTGGGPGKDFPPTLRDLFIPPLPAPERIKPYHLIAWFDVDERGNSNLIAFNPSRDRGYNNRLNDVLRSLRFRPGVRANGTPMRDTVDVHFIF